jgi:hypothetical protein
MRATAPAPPGRCVDRSPLFPSVDAGCCCAARARDRASCARARRARGGSECTRMRRRCVSPVSECAEANFTIAQSSQQHFHQYVIPLTFTVLALSLQTSKFGLSLPADVSELLSWISLLVSGLIGLTRWELTLHLHKMFVHQADIDLRTEGLQRAKSISPRGQVTIAARGRCLRGKRDCKIAGVEGQAQCTRRCETAKHLGAIQMAMAMFAVGIISLGASRSFLPISNIVHSLVNHAFYSSR